MLLPTGLSPLVATVFPPKPLVTPNRPSHRISEVCRRTSTTMIRKLLSQQRLPIYFFIPGGSAKYHVASVIGQETPSQPPPTLQEWRPTAPTFGRRQVRNGNVIGAAHRLEIKLRFQGSCDSGQAVYVEELINSKYSRHLQFS